MNKIEIEVRTDPGCGGATIANHLAQLLKDFKVSILDDETTPKWLESLPDRVRNLRTTDHEIVISCVQNSKRKK